MRWSISALRLGSPFGSDMRRTGTYDVAEEAARLRKLPCFVLASKGDRLGGRGVRPDMLPIDPETERIEQRRTWLTQCVRGLWELVRGAVTLQVTVD